MYYYDYYYQTYYHHHYYYCEAETQLTDHDESWRQTLEEESELRYMCAASAVVHGM